MSGREARAAGALRSAEETSDSRGDLLAALFEHSPVAEGLLDRELRYLRVNPALAAINGLPVEEHLGRSVAEVIPELASVVEPLVRRALAGETVDVELAGPHPTAQGQEGHWLVSYYPIHGADGEVTAVGLIVVDITRRVGAEAARRASEARRDAIVESSLDAIVTMTADGRIVEFNSAAEAMFGLPREDALGRELAETLVPEHLRASHAPGSRGIGRPARRL